MLPLRHASPKSGLRASGQTGTSPHSWLRARVVAARMPVYRAGGVVPFAEGMVRRNIVRRHIVRRLGAGALAAAAAIALSGTALADPVADFYRGKSINLYIGTTAGGGYDIYARLVARFMGGHIPGKPMIVPRSMPGAGTRNAAGYVYNVVPKDGLSLNASEQALALEQALGDETMAFDMAQVNWIGSPDSDNKVVVTWHTSGIATIEDAKAQEVVMGATSD